MAVRFARGEERCQCLQCLLVPLQRQQRQPFISQAFYSRSDKLNTNFQHGIPEPRLFFVPLLVSVAQWSVAGHRVRAPSII